MADDTNFLLRVDGQIQKVLNKKQFLKLFPAKTRELEEFISSNNTSFKSQNDLISLVEFCNALNR